jgi:hypothetical protein
VFKKLFDVIIGDTICGFLQSFVHVVVLPWI